MIKVVFFDIDGTLVSHTHTIVPESSKRAIEELQKKGIMCVLATGRHLVEMEQLPTGDMVRAKVFDGYVSLNGQVVCDKHRNIIYKNPIEGKSKEILVQRFQAMEMPTALLEFDRIYINFSNEDAVRGQGEISSPVPDIGEYHGGDFFQAFSFGQGNFAEELRELLPDCRVINWCDCAVDINDSKGSKMIGIQKFLEHVGVKQEETMSFGDGDNDVEMLQFSQIGVAMANGTEKCRAAADYVTDSVDEDGIWNALVHYGLVEE